MAIGVWGHNFPASKDEHPAYIDWPTAEYDVIIALFLHEIFTALDAIQDALGYDITGEFDNLKAWLDDIESRIGVPGEPYEIRDDDGDSYETVEKTADSDTAETYLKNILVRKFHDDGILDLAKQSRCNVYLGTPQSIPTGAYTKIELDTEILDNQNEFDPITNYRFTAKKAGLYVVVAQASYTSSVDAISYGTDIYKNGGIISEVNIHASTASFGINPLISRIVPLAANDFIEIYTRHFSGVAKTIYNHPATTFVTIHKLS